MDSSVKDTALSDHDLLIRLDGKVDQFINSVADHEARLRLVEQDRDKLQGSIQALRWLGAVLTLISVVLGTIVAWLALIK